MAETEPFTFAGERKNEKYYVEWGSTPDLSGLATDTRVKFLNDYTYNFFK